MPSDRLFSKEDLLRLLAELGKEFRKRNGTKMKAEVIIVGGASILLNYGFREMTMDIDALILASSAMKEAISAVADVNHISSNWINSDFMKTPSYSKELALHSTYYRTFSNVLIIRTIQAEYLIAMKLNSGRKYKRDMSDIIGIILAQQEAGDPITMEKINRAISELYGPSYTLSDPTVHFLESALNAKDLNSIYDNQIALENENRGIVLREMERDPEEIRKGDINAVIDAAKKKLQS